MTHDIQHYSTLVFDCDGVILDSNRIKSEAFHKAALPYGTEAADALVAYHVSRGGVSRFAKFEHFLTHIVAEPADKAALDILLESYAAHVREGLLTCAITPDLQDLRDRTPDMRWLIVSGGAQNELRDVFARRGLAAMFDGGIFGSPDTKDEILARELAGGTITRPALFLGDSKYDHLAAREAELDFLFVSGWSEMPDWEGYIRQNGIGRVTAVRDIMR